MSKVIFLSLLCLAVVSAGSVKSAAPKTGEKQRDFGIGLHNSHPEILSVHHGQGHGHGGGGGGWGGGHGVSGGGEGWGGWGGGGQGGVGGHGWGEYPALADIVALVLNLLVLAAFGGLVYLLLSPLLGGGGDGWDGWGRSIGATPYYEAFKDGGLLSRVLNSVDYVDSTFAVMKISGDGCRKRIACEMEKSAGRNKVFNYTTNWFRNRMRSMDMYKDAVVSGDKQEDCVQKYPDCTYTLVDKIGKWFN